MNKLEQEDKVVEEKNTVHVGTSGRAHGGQVRRVVLRPLARRRARFSSC